MSSAEQLRKFGQRSLIARTISPIDEMLAAASDTRGLLVSLLATALVEAELTLQP